MKILINAFCMNARVHNFKQFLNLEASRNHEHKERSKNVCR
jgi:hypothetical protein